MSDAPRPRALLLSRVDDPTARTLVQQLGDMGVNVELRGPGELLADASLADLGAVIFAPASRDEIPGLLRLTGSVPRDRRHLILLPGLDPDDAKELFGAFDPDRILDRVEGPEDERLRAFAMAIAARAAAGGQEDAARTPGPPDPAALSKAARKRATSGASAVQEPPTDGAIGSSASADVPAPEESPASADAASLTPPPPAPDEAFGNGTEIDPAVVDRLSPSSRQAIAEAVRVAQLANLPEIHADHLFLGLYRKPDGPARRLVRSADPPLSEETLASVLHVDTGALDRGDAGPVAWPTIPIRVSGHVREALVGAGVAADRVAGSTDPRRTIHSRHLLYGLLGVGECSLVRALREQGLRADAVDISLPVAKRGDASDIAGFRSDVASGKDLLDIRREVDALAKVIAAIDVDPPLAIGLFGDWGTGKTFFMKQLEGRIEEIAKAEQARTAGEPVYHARIVQLTFNAWHYIEQNLWASLASAIFDGLDAALALQRVPVDDQDKDALERARLQTERARALDDLARAERDGAQATARLAATGARLQQLDTMFDEFARDMRPRDFVVAGWNVAVEQLRLQDELAAIEQSVTAKVVATAKGLGVDKAVLTGPITDRRGPAAWLRSALVAVFRGSRMWVPIAAAAILGFVAVLAAWTLTAGSPTVTALSGVVAAVVGVASPVLVAGTRIWAVIRQARAAGLRKIEEQRERRRQELLAEQARDAALAAKAEQRAAEAREVVSKADRDLEAGRPRRQLADFVSGRRASTDYRSHLGVVAQARGDFEQLSRLLKQAQAAPGAPPGEPAASVATDTAFLPTIDRIVLYVDDLDRCTEKDVVAVLQAVNLLLAFPLFVVVVAVDPRWLVHSLEVASRVFDGPEGRDGEQPDASETEAEAEWVATPLNYLEKIFQIPFAIMPMGPGGFRAMINDLVRPVERHGGETGRIREESLNRTEAPPADRQQVGARPEPGATPGPSTGQQDTPPPATSTQPTPSSEATTSAEARSVDLDASFLAIGDAERAFMTTLHPLISTPRAAKRFVNVYRLLKASAPAARRAALEDEANHRAVLLLLAMLTGYPAETTAVLRRLIEKDVKALGWWTLTRQVVREGRLERPATAEGRLRNEQWDQFEAQLDRVAKAWPGRPPVGPFVDWAPEVARYSFQSSRVLVGRSEPHEAPPAEGPTRASRRVAPPRGPASTGSSGRAAGRTQS